MGEQPKEFCHTCYSLGVALVNGVAICEVCGTQSLVGTAGTDTLPAVRCGG